MMNNPTRHFKKIPYATGSECEKDVNSLRPTREFMFNVRKIFFT